MGDRAPAAQNDPYLVQVGTDFDGPADVTSWPGNPKLLVVAERGSGLVVVVPEGSGSPPPDASVVVDLSSTAVIPDPSASWAVQFGGLTGIAFHPRFNDGRRYRYIFVRYNTGDPGNQSNPEVDVVIERFAIPTGMTSADMASRTIVFREPFQAGGLDSHMSGRIKFDPRTFYDGTGTTVDDEIYHLHAPMGDMLPGSGDCSPGFEDAYDLTDNSVPPNELYAGKLLRFSIGPGALATGPGVPKVDPYVYGRGLRNPYSFTVDRAPEDTSVNGDVWLTDTGQEGVGEIMRWVPPAEGVVDLLSGGVGQDYGWPWVETTLDVGGLAVSNISSVCWGVGTSPNPFPSPSDFPLADYALPTNQGTAVVGLSIYRGQDLDQATYEGRLLYAFWGASPPVLVWRDRNDLLNLSNMTLPDDLETVLVDGMTNAFGSTGPEQWVLAGMGEDTDGELLLIRIDQGTNSLLGNGTIFRVTQ